MILSRFGCGGLGGAWLEDEGAALACDDARRGTGMIGRDKQRRGAPATEAERKSKNENERQYAAAARQRGDAAGRCSMSLDHCSRLAYEDLRQGGLPVAAGATPAAALPAAANARPPLHSTQCLLALLPALSLSCVRLAAAPFV